MATTLATFNTQVQILLGPNDATTELSSAQIDAMIKAAVERYSHDAPDDLAEDESGDGGRYYDIASLLGSWVEDFSSITRIEYPAQAIADDEIPQYLGKEDWRDDYWQGGTRYLFLPNHSPAATETMRIEYTIPYVWTDPGGGEQTTTPAQDFYAICHLAAGLCCQAIAAKYSRTSDSTITADSARHTSRAAEFARRAREYISFYENHLGLGDAGADTIKGAGEFVDMDTAPSWPTGRRYLFHHRDTR